MSESERLNRNAQVSREKLFVVKVQVATAGEMPCMVYDRKRSLQVLTSPELITPTSASVQHESVRAMEEVIRSRGVMGLKAYFVRDPLCLESRLRLFSSIDKIVGSTFHNVKVLHAEHTSLLACLSPIIKESKRFLTVRDPVEQNAYVTNDKKLRCRIWWRHRGGSGDKLGKDAGGFPAHFPVLQTLIHIFVYMNVLYERALFE